MAPEQARGEPLTPRSDVFALGVVLYELLTGAHPFGRQVTHEERDSEPMRVIPPRVVKPSIPHGLDAICMRALAHDPRDRYSRMQQMIDALVEERFANQYREGASDLAQAIRECSVQSPVLAQPRTMVTDRPVTIVTRSLIEQTPHRRSAPRMSSPSLTQSRGSTSHLSRTSSPSVSQSASRTSSPSVSQSVSRSRSAHGTPAPIPESGAQTQPSDELLRAAALLELPPMLRADGTPMPPFRLSHQAMQGDELNSVVGGNTATGVIPGLVVQSERSNTRWTIAILGIAALIGAIAAVVIQLTPSESATPPAPSSQPAQVEPPLPTPQPSITQDLSQTIAPEPKKEEPPPAPVVTEPTVAEAKVPDEKIEEVAESIAISQQWRDDVRIVLFVRLREGLTLDDRLRDKIRTTIRGNTTPRHVPARIVQALDLPRTINGKLVELAVREVVHGRAVKNTDALANPQALDYFKDLPELQA
jgi:hypothetical protein